MNTKHIRKIRKKILGFTDYEVQESFSLFGAPFGLTKVSYVKSDSPKNAVARYLKHYSIAFKEYHKWSWYFYNRNMASTSSTFAKFKVIDVKTGFKYYY